MPASAASLWGRVETRQNRANDHFSQQQETSQGADTHGAGYTAPRKGETPNPEPRERGGWNRKVSDSRRLMRKVAPADVAGEVKAIYAELDGRPFERNCTSTTTCCRFQVMGKTPFLTKAEVQRESIITARSAPTEWQGGRVRHRSTGRLAFDLRAPRGASNHVEDNVSHYGGVPRRDALGAQKKQDFRQSREKYLKML